MRPHGRQSGHSVSVGWGSWQAGQQREANEGDESGLSASLCDLSSHSLQLLVSEHPADHGREVGTRTGEIVGRRRKRLKVREAVVSVWHGALICSTSQHQTKAAVAYKRSG